jgi:acyl phosphate:glycerol-3-phosphate acyltransferase
MNITDYLIFAGIVIVSYVLGSIPFGFLVVRAVTGKDLRSIESGRTGGTNAGRAAGFTAGAVTAVLDFLKGAITVWIVRAFFPEYPWVQIFPPLAAIIGHNYSLFLIERNEDGTAHFRGGAGGASCLGGSFGLWPPSLLLILPLALIALFGIGYASVATLSMAFFSIVLFAVRAAMGLSPWAYVLYGVLAETLLVIALIPNIKRLIAGNERIVGLRAKKKKTE